MFGEAAALGDTGGEPASDFSDFLERVHSACSFRCFATTSGLGKVKKLHVEHLLLSINNVERPTFPTTVGQWASARYARTHARTKPWSRTDVRAIVYFNSTRDRDKKST